MTIKSTLSLIGLVVIILLLGSWFKQGQLQSYGENGTNSYLPDHITEIEGTTLPRAIQEARSRGKQYVRVTDPAGNVITADIGKQTHTTFTLTDPGTDPLAVLLEYRVPVEKAFGITTGTDGSFTFSVSALNSAEIASMMYEMSVRLFHIDSTTNWTIDIE